MKQCVIPVPSLDGSVLGVQMCAVSARAAKGFIGRLRGIHEVPNGLIWLPQVTAVQGWTLQESLWLVWLDHAGDPLAWRWLHPGQVAWAPPHSDGALEISLMACRRLVCED